MCQCKALWVNIEDTRQIQVYLGMFLTVVGQHYLSGVVKRLEC